MYMQRCLHRVLSKRHISHGPHPMVSWCPVRPRRAHHKARRQYVNATAADDVQTLTGEDFYSLLGLSPYATSSEIRTAYRHLMRELHPDLVLQSGEDVQEQATTLATLLNQVYDTLMDPDTRAVYDMLAGFAEDTSTNPFLDKTFPRDQVFVDEVTCIGCGKCVRACPSTFEIEASKYGRARVISQTAAEVEEIEIAIEVCPVNCIYWVSLPQLSLLEAALAVLPRVEVFILQRSGNRAVGNVFEVAFKAYERRREAMSAKARAAAAAAAGKGKHVKFQEWTWWTARAPDQDTQQGSGGGGGDDQNGEMASGGQQQRRVASLAAMAARAVRLWQSQGRSVRVRGALMDTSSASEDGQ